MPPELHPIMESYQWMSGPPFEIVDTGKRTVTIRGTAVKSGQISRNNRRYVDEELVKGARTWIGAPVTINHAPYDKSDAFYDPTKIAGNVRWMEYEDGALEFMADIKKQPYVDLLRNKSVEIKGVSIEANYLFNRCNKCGRDFYTTEEFDDHMVHEHYMRNFVYEPRGLQGTALSLVLGPEEPGIPDTTIELMEQYHRPLFKGLSQLLETVTQITKEKEEWMNKKRNLPVAITAPRSIAVGRVKPIVREQTEDDTVIEPGSHYCQTHPDDPRCQAHQQAIHGDQHASEENGDGCPDGQRRNPDTGECEPVSTDQPSTEEQDMTTDAPVPVETQPEPVAPPVEHDAHGCVVGEEKWDGAKCVPIATGVGIMPETPLEPVASEQADAMAAPVPQQPLEPIPTPHATPTVITVDDTVETPEAPITPAETPAIAAPVVTIPTPDETVVVELSSLRLGEPFADYTNFDDCVSKNQGKVDDPEAYCATIKRKAEGETIESATASDNIYETAQSIVATLASNDHRQYVRAVRLAEAVNRLNTAVHQLATMRNRDVKQLIQLSESSIKQYGDALTKAINTAFEQMPKDDTTWQHHITTITNLLNDMRQATREWTASASKTVNANATAIRQSQKRLATVETATRHIQQTHLASTKRLAVVEASVTKVQHDHAGWRSEFDTVLKTADENVTKLEAELAETSKKLEDEQRKQLETRETTEKNIQESLDGLITRIDNLEFAQPNVFQGNAKQQAPPNTDTDNDNTPYNDPMKSEGQ